MDDKILQLNMISDIEQIGKGDWIEVLNIDHNIKDGQNIYKFSVLLNKVNKKEELEDNSFSSYLYLSPYCDGNGRYFRFGSEKYEPIVYYRVNEITKENEIGIYDEFIFFYDLYKHENKYYKIDESGDKECVVKIEEKSIKIKTDYLINYISIKNKILSIGFEYNFYSFEKFEQNDNFYKEIKGDNFIYTHSYGKYDLEYNSFGRILGKKIISGIKKENTNLFEYKKHEYADFIVGKDRNGKIIYHTCNPNKLNSPYFSNDKINSLTPVYFKKDVLDKYYKNDNIEVSVNLISANGWYLSIDKEHSDIVIVPLYKLGFIPYEEQLYWKSFNIYSKEKISKFEKDLRYNADFNAKPEDIIEIFKEKYKNVNEKWKNKFGFNLFRNLHSDDKQCYDNLRIPTSKSRETFETQIIYLSKIMVDALNEKEIGSSITNADYDKEKIKGSINKLEYFLKEKTQEDIKVIIENLRNIQNFRSSSTAHCKGDNYKKIIKKLKFEGKDYSDIFKEFIKISVSVLDKLFQI